jgi:CheY-like chemotaxis protein
VKAESQELSAAMETKNTADLFPKEKKHLHILVVDESTAIRRIHDRILSEAGHKVVTAASGAEGLSAIRKATAEVAYGNRDAGFDVVAISHLMAGISGPQAVQKMRQQLQGKPCIILGVTSETSPADITAMKSSGADAVIAKPLTLKKFKRVLRGDASMCVIVELQLLLDLVEIDIAERCFFLFPSNVISVVFRFILCIVCYGSRLINLLYASCRSVFRLCDECC